MTITRGSTGKQVYRDFTEYADQAAYNAAFGADDAVLTMDAANDYVKDTTTGSGGDLGGVYTGATYQNLYLRCRMIITGGTDNTQWAAIGLRRVTASGSWAAGANKIYFSLIRKGGNMQMIKNVSGSVTAIVGDTASGIDPTAAEFDFTMTANGTALETLVNGVSKMATTDTSISAAGYVEMISQQNVTSYFTDLCVCSATTITCSGLGAGSGYQLRVTDRDSTTAKATEVAGTATVACKTLMFPGDKVEVLTGADVVVEESALTDDVWGGDAFTYTASSGSTRRRFAILVGCFMGFLLQGVIIWKSLFSSMTHYGRNFSRTLPCWTGPLTRLPHNWIRGSTQYAPSS